MNLESYGWNASLQQALDEFEDPTLAPARVARQERTEWRVISGAGPVSARLAGRARHEPPVVGDWVAGRPDALGGWTIHARLPRRGTLAREGQVVAAHVDVTLACAALDRPFNARRVERFLAVAHETRAVVVLTKADLAQDAAAALAQARALGAPAILTSAARGIGLDEARALVAPGVTVAILGPSGAGKSSLANALLGEDRLATGDVRASDRKGRHTTTWRELVPLRGGGVLLDTPGLREVGLADAEGVAGAFADVETLAAACRFRDCAHDSEPGCAVRDALPAARIEAWRKLQREGLRAAARRDAALGARLRKEERRVHRERTREMRDQ